ncbi:MAG: chromosome segregation protein SMC, partial [Clostridia bacterium]|nr:chromosome segregation protein SMC [Clostridia bacterium]
VGPNGSGKSNIADAVRWVLGEQNARSLRGGKMEDIIFNGTEKRKKLGYCEVSLVFDNADQALASDYAEVQVTRRVFRSGESEYSLNKAPCRLKDIIDLFRDTGIGKEGYSLIGQGRIDEILSVKSEDRRQVFEEAAGIVKYKSRKEEAERRMQNTRHNLTRVEDIIEELGNQLEPLAQQSEQARRYLLLRDQLRGLELNAFLVRSDRVQERVAAIGKTLEGLGEAVAQAEEREREQGARRAEIEEGIVGQDRLVSEAHGQVLELTRSLEACEGGNNVLRADIAHTAQDEERLLAERGDAQQRLSALEALHASAAGDQTEQHSLLDVQRKELERMEALQSEAEVEAEAREQALDAHKTAIMEAMNRLSDVRSTQTRLTTMRQSLEKRLEELRAADIDMDGEAARLQEAVRAAEASQHSVGEEMARLSQEAANLDAQVRATAQQADALGEELAQSTGKQQGLSSRLRVLREMERDYEGYQHAVKQVLLRAKEEKGVHGVVATLLRVPKEYEKPVEAVLGAALQHVVTQDEYVAKRLIGYLRQRQFGRATFLPMSAVRGRTLSPQERQLLQMPGCLGVASELVSFDAPYRGVMESLLGRTVIAKDLDSGIEIMRRGHHAFRLVTLEGDVMHSGGSMTGGSAHSRITSLLSREREIAEHEKALRELGGKIAGIKGELEAIEGRRAEEKRLRGELFAALHQEEIAVAREQERLSRAQDEYGGHREKRAQQRLMCEQIEDNLRDIAEQMNEIDAHQDGAEQDTAQMHQRTQTLQSELGEAREEANRRREKATDKRIALAALEHEMEVLRRDAARLAAEQEELRRYLERQGGQLTRCQEAARQHASQLEAGEAEQCACQERLQEACAALEALQAERTRLQEALHAQGQEMDALRAGLNADIDKRHRAELQLTRLEGDLKQLQDRIWDEYELTYAGAKEFETPGFALGPAEKEIDDIRGQIREMGSVNVNAIEDYRNCHARYDDLCTQREDLTRAEEDLHGIIEGLLVKMEKQFREQFELLGGYFSQTFARLFGGGQAALKLQDPTDVLNCGIEIVAQPPGKKLQLLTLLSGGERALTAIAILFAMLRL